MYNTWNSAFLLVIIFFRILEGVGFSSPPFLLLQNEILLVSTKMQFAQLLKVNDPEPHCQRNKKVCNQIRRVFKICMRKVGVNRLNLYVQLLKSLPRPFQAE